MIRKIILDGIPVEYQLERKNVKNFNLRIKSDMTVHVSVNRFVSQKTVDSFLMSKSDYIIGALKRFEEKAKNTPEPLQYNDGDIIEFLGEKKYLSLTQGKNSVSINEKYIILSVNDTDNEQLKKRVLNNWYRQRCMEVIKGFCDKVYPDFEHYKVAYPQIKLRSMTARWGSCRPVSGVLTFNTALITVPVKCIEYVVYHEFTHFLQPDHSKNFYLLLESFLPNWKERKTLLEQYGVNIKKYNI